MEADEKICPRCAETVKMAAKICKHCGYELTAAERPIPAPGSPAAPPVSQPAPAQQPVQVDPPYRPYSAPPPPPQVAADPPARGRGLLIVLAVIVGVILVLGLIGLAVGPESPGDAKQAVSTDTSSGGSASPDSAGNSDRNAAPADNGGSAGSGDNAQQADTTAVSSVELARAYNANEVNAQNTYGGKTLDVTGTITGVKLDLFNNPVVEMEGVNEFLPVQATFDQSYSQKVSALSKGQEITVRCTQITEVVSAPMLSECSLPE
jgi:tRNA_anti-like/Uncharacterised protein family UPF0547